MILKLKPIILYVTFEKLPFQIQNYIHIKDVEPAYVIQFRHCGKLYLPIWSKNRHQSNMDFLAQNKVNTSRYKQAI